MKNHRTVRYNIQIFCKRRRNDSLFTVPFGISNLTQSTRLWLLFHSDFYIEHDHDISSTCTSLVNDLFLQNPNSESVLQRPTVAVYLLPVMSIHWPDFDSKIP